MTLYNVFFKHVICKKIRTYKSDVHIKHKYNEHIHMIINQLIYTMTSYKSDV